MERWIGLFNSEQQFSNYGDYHADHQIYDKTSESDQQRVHTGLSDGSGWNFGYDSLGQVTSGKRNWVDGGFVAGQQFQYTFDDIGNRKTTSVGGDEAGLGLKSATNTINSVNQISPRDVPGFLNVVGVANAGATVTVNGQVAYRHNDYFRNEVSVNNSTGAVYFAITNQSVFSGNTETVTGNALLPAMPETLLYDAHGNVVSDGKWTNIWDFENHLLTMTSLSTLPSSAKKKLDFTYDTQGRRIQKIVSTWNVNGSPIRAGVNRQKEFRSQSFLSLIKSGLATTARAVRSLRGIRTRHFIF